MHPIHLQRIQYLITKNWIEALYLKENLRDLMQCLFRISIQKDNKILKTLTGYKI